ANGLNGARRISATRKATAPLKAWLTDHGTYPYPTKDEKVVPAVTAMMTLTQVIAWCVRRLEDERSAERQKILKE
ncbi:hypothetical protein KIN20_009649, partial [Parelaphostrongylus tenuis]